MIVRFILSNESAKKLGGLFKQVHKLRFDKDSLAGENGAGAIFEKDGVLYTREKFLAARNNLGAVLVAQNKWQVCECLGLPIDEAGIVEGLTESEYAKAIGKSRQYVHKMVKTGKIAAMKIGKTWIIDNEAEKEDEKLARQGGGEGL